MPARPILKIIHNKKALTKASKKIAEPRWKLIKKHLNGKSLLEIGLGIGTIAKLATIDGYKTTGLDVDNTSIYPEIQPILYNGLHFPFPNNAFDNATLICVLHHCQNQEQVLREAMRVARKIIVIEDTYRNPIEHMLIAIRDSIENWEFYHHTYRSYEEWKHLCKSNNWKVKHIKSWSSFDFGILYGHQTCFSIEK